MITNKGTDRGPWRRLTNGSVGISQVTAEAIAERLKERFGVSREEAEQLFRALMTARSQAAESGSQSI